EEDRGLGRVLVEVLALAVEHAEGDERVEEVAPRARVELQPVGELLPLERSLRELGKEAELDRREERLRGPEGGAELHDLGGRELCGHGVSSRNGRAGSYRDAARSASIAFAATSGPACEWRESSTATSPA